MVRALAVLSMVALGCPKQVPGSSFAPKAERLLADTPELETGQRTQTRDDLEVDTRDFERTPRIVATGETGAMSAEGAEVRLAGDDTGTKGFFVDNFILLEVIAPDGKVTNRAVVGFTDTVSMGKETLDNLGRKAFSFEAGEVVLNPILPERGSFRLRATALDYGGVGRVSDVFVTVRARASTSDELRAQ